MQATGRIITAGLVLGVLAGQAGAQIGDKLYIQGARIITMAGPEIEKGAILIEAGKITGIGKDLAKPFDAWVLDAEGKTIMPGFIDPMTQRGLDVPNENIDIGAMVEVYDAIDPSERDLEIALRNGSTAMHVCQGNNCVISGVSRVIRPIGMTVQDMTIRADGGLKVSFAPKTNYDHGVQMAILREAFQELDRYLETLAEQLYEDDLKAKGEEVKVGPAEARKLGKDLVTPAKMDDAHRNLYRFREGWLDVYVYCGRAMEVAPALEFLKNMNLGAKSSLVLGSECFKVAGKLAGLARPVIVTDGDFVHRERDRITLEEKDTFMPKALAEAKVPFAVGNAENPRLAAAALVRGGITREMALASITSAAARAIGLDHRMGTLETGKDGNLVILTGDPLELSTFVEEVVIEGRRVYERSKDRRLRDILQGIHDTAQDEKRQAEEQEKKKEAEKAKPDEKKPEEKKPEEKKEGEPKPPETPATEGKKD